MLLDQSLLFELKLPPQIFLLSLLLTSNAVLTQFRLVIRASNEPVEVRKTYGMVAMRLLEGARVVRRIEVVKESYDFPESQLNALLFHLLLK